MESTNTSTSRRQALQQMLAISIGTGLLGTNVIETSAQSIKKNNKIKGPLKPFYIPPAASLQVNAHGVNMRTLVRSSQTNAQYSCVEFIVGPKQMGPPPHIHKDLDEIMFVSEGTVIVMVGETLYEVQAGGWHMRPHGIVHTFWNAGEKPVRYVDMYFNQNFEDFLEELNFKLFPYMEENNLTPADPKIAKWWAGLDKKFGITTFFDQRQPIIDKYHLKP